MCSKNVVGTGRKLEELEREICQLASHIHAATCRWLRLLAEFDRREGWAAWGCRSCAHWVAWRCGIAPAAAREHVRVARRLEGLPLIARAFGEGRLSYSKVRALTRVGEVAEEEELLELGRHATAAQLERLVRSYRGVRAVEAQARGGRPERWLAWSYDDDGSLLLRGRLPGEEGALVVAAIEAGMDALHADVSAEAPAPVDATPDERVSAEAPAAAGSAVEDRVSADAPAPAGSAVEERVSAEAPSKATRGERRADALLLLAEAQLASAAARAGDRYQVVVHVDQQSLAAERVTEGNDREGTAGDRRCELDAGVPIAAETARRLACDASIVPMLARGGRSPDVGRKRRTIPPALQRALTARDRGCRFPGCGARRFVDAHHVRHWADGGPTSMRNLVQLCRHHHRLLHEGGFTVSGDPGGELRFHRPDGRRIRACPRPPRGEPGGARPRRGDPHVESRACLSLSAGERMDLDLGVAALLAWTRQEPALGAQEAVGL